MIKRFVPIAVAFFILAQTNRLLAQRVDPAAPPGTRTEHIAPGTLIDDKTHEAAPERSAGADHADPHKTKIEYSHPTLPPLYATWAGAMLIVIAGMFLAAAVIGPVIRSEMPEEIPDAHSHDEPPGASGHHGPSGTQTPTPDHHH